MNCANASEDVDIDNGKCWKMAKIQRPKTNYTNDQRLVVMVWGRLQIYNGGQINIGRGWHHDKNMRKYVDFTEIEPKK